MKKLIMALLIVLFALPALAQDDSEGSLNRAIWYVGPAARVTQLNGATGILTGLEAGWNALPEFTIGLAVYRLANNLEADRPDADGARYTDFFYSGVTAAYSVAVAPRIKANIHALVGGGEAHWREGALRKMRRDDEHTTSLMLEPGLGLTVTFAPWLQAAIGAEYRYVTAGESRVMRQEDMRGFTGTFGFRFGHF